MSIPLPIPIRVRPATPEDYAAVSVVANAVQELHATHEPTMFRHGDAALPADYYEYLLKELSGAIYVAARGEEIVGYLVLELERAYAGGDGVRRRAAKVEQIGVAAGARGAGVGRALMEAAVAWAKTHDADTLRLHVWEFNQDAIGFYEHIGMQTESRTMALSLRER